MQPFYFLSSRSMSSATIRSDHRAKTTTACSRVNMAARFSCSRMARICADRMPLCCHVPDTSVAACVSGKIIRGYVMCGESRKPGLWYLTARGFSSISQTNSRMSFVFTRKLKFRTCVLFVPFRMFKSTRREDIYLTYIIQSQAIVKPKPKPK